MTEPKIALLHTSVAAGTFTFDSSGKPMPWENLDEVHRVLELWSNKFLSVLPTFISNNAEPMLIPIDSVTRIWMGPTVKSLEEARACGRRAAEEEADMDAEIVTRDQKDFYCYDPNSGVVNIIQAQDAKAAMELFRNGPDGDDFETADDGFQCIQVTQFHRDIADLRVLDLEIETGEGLSLSYETLDRLVQSGWVGRLPCVNEESSDPEDQFRYKLTTAGNVLVSERDDVAEYLFEKVINN